ncbi:MAG: hypothetical protein KI790_12780 [Cyclobacteriaceae bacterium]|nr:hypothetical protein [Cyclobacteriaceae bacterium HetDA_MAG_MS6]
MLRRILMLTTLSTIATYVSAQNSVGVGTETPNPNAVLELVSPGNNQGFLVPRLTTAQRTDAAFETNLTNAENGLLVFDTDENQFFFWISGSWQPVSNQIVQNDNDSTNEIQDLQLVGNDLSITGNSGATAIDLSPYLDNTDAQDATQVNIIGPITNLSATTVEDAIAELQSDIDNDGGGNMLQSIYDVDTDNVVDSAANAGMVNSLTVETAVPSSAVFTDDQDATQVNIVGPIPNLSATSVEGALAELQSDIDNDGGGDMLQSIYDTNTDNVIDSAANAGTVNSLTVETAVPSSAVFTDDQTLTEILSAGNDAGSLTISNLADPTIAQEAATKNYVDTQLAGVTSSQWTTTGDDITYSTGSVGIGTSTPLSDLQVNEDLHIFHYENTGLSIDGEIIANNMYADTTALLHAKDGPLSFVFLREGALQFMSSDSAGAGTNALTEITTLLDLKAAGDAEFRGAVEVGELRDSTSFSSGTIAFYAGQFYGYNGSQWLSLGGLSLPANEIVNENSTPFEIVNQGIGGVARYQVDNSSGGTALMIESNSAEATARGIEVQHSGAGSAGQFSITGTSGGPTQYAVFGSTQGNGSAGRFEVDNGTSTASALIGRVDNGLGNAVEGYNAGDGPAGRFNVVNTSNTSTALIAQTSGAGGVASFSNTSSATTDAVTITNNGSGSALDISSGGNTTRFGANANFAGRVSIGHFTPNVSLDIQGADAVRIPTGNTGTRPSSPAQGMIRYNTDSAAYESHDGASWKAFVSEDTNGDVTTRGTGEFVYANVQTRTMAISGKAFQVEGVNTGQALATAGGATGTYVANGNSEILATLFAGVNLPDGSVITQFDAWVVDNDGTTGYNISVSLVRSAHGVRTGAALSNVTTDDGATNAEPQLLSNTPGATPIDNANYHYYLSCNTRQQNSNLALLSVIITYRVSKPD